jgi:hypothetical protein
MATQIIKTLQKTIHRVETLLKTNRNAFLRVQPMIHCLLSMETTTVPVKTKAAKEN